MIRFPCRWSTVHAPQRGPRSINDWRVQQNFILPVQSQNIHEHEILHPKNTWHQNFLPKRIQDLNTSIILIYSIKQTLKPKKKYVTDPLTQKSMEGVYFQPSPPPKKNKSDLPVMYPASTLPLWGHAHLPNGRRLM